MSAKGSENMEVEMKKVTNAFTSFVQDVEDKNYRNHYMRMCIPHWNPQKTRVFNVEIKE